jgi:hypothetical protein
MISFSKKSCKEYIIVATSVMKIIGGLNALRNFILEGIRYSHKNN